MRYVLMCAATGALFVSTAKADETVKWRHVMHATSFQTQQVGDVPGHNLNLSRSPGIAFFPDGSTGTSLVIGTSDSLAGSGGTANGYYTVKFADGSELWLKYSGSFKFGNPKVAQKGTAIVIGGTGRYAGATGDGTFEGESTQPLAGGDAITFIDNVINIKK